MMTKTYLITIGISGFIAMLMASLGSHIMFNNLTPEHFNAYNTAVQIQMVNTLVLLGLAFMNRYVQRALINSVYFLFVIGGVFFSGSIYLTSTIELTKVDFGFLSALAPIGGVLLMIGWLVIMWMGVTYVHHKRRHRNDEE